MDRSKGGGIRGYIVKIDGDNVVGAAWSDVWEVGFGYCNFKVGHDKENKGKSIEKPYNRGG